MTRPSAPAVITAGALLTWAAAAYGYAAITGNWYAGGCGVILTAGAGTALWLLWTVTDAQDGGSIEAVMHATREGIDKEVADFAAELEHW